MKVLFVHPGPDFSVSDVFDGWVKAFKKQNHRVMVYNTNERLKFFGDAYSKDPETGEFKLAMEDNEAVLASFEALGHHLYSFWPDLVIFVSAFYVRQEILQLIRARGHKLVIIHTESPYQDDEQLMRAQFANLNILNDPANIEEYRCLSKAEYIPHAYDPDRHYPGHGDRNIDFSFVGSMFASRVSFFERFIEALGEEWLSQHDIALGGQAWSNKRLDGSPLLNYLGHPRAHAIDNSETANIYRRTKVGINVYRQEGEATHADEGWAMGPREVELAACGVPFLRDSRPESDEVFGWLLPAFESPEHAADLLKWYLASPDRAERMGKEAAYQVRHRTFDNNAARLMNLLDL